MLSNIPGEKGFLSIINSAKGGSLCLQAAEQIKLPVKLQVLMWGEKKKSHSSRGTVAVRGSRVAFISSVWIVENLVLLVGRKWKFKMCPSLFSYCYCGDNGQDLVQLRVLD